MSTDSRLVTIVAIVAAIVVAGAITVADVLQRHQPSRRALVAPDRAPAEALLLDRSEPNP